MSLRYDLNQISYNYRVEVTIRFKGLDLIECLKNYRQRFVTLHRRQGSKHSQEKEMQKGKTVVSRGLKMAEKRREAKSKGEKERYSHLNAKFQRIARSDKKAFLSDQCKENARKITVWESLEISSRKLEIPREHFMQRWA